MSDLLQNLYKERRLMSDRVHNIELYLKKKSDVISTIPYTDEDLQREIQRYKEVQVAINAILKFRKQLSNTGTAAKNGK